MKKKVVRVLVFLTLINSLNHLLAQTPNYLNETPPKNISIKFGEKIITLKGTYHIVVAFHPNQREIYWLAANPNPSKNSEIKYVKFLGGKWTSPKSFEHNIGYNTISMSISPDGNKLHFTSNRPLPKNFEKQPERGQKGYYNNWFCERNGDSWDKPKLLPKKINNVMGVTETMMHTLYADGINKSELVNGEYQAWESISQKLNIGKSQGGNPFIAPDESYILFGRRRSSIGSDIFISFKTNANQWSEPKNLSKAMGIETAASQPIIIIAFLPSFRLFFKIFG